ncbi:MAG: hypothetical protein FJX60_11530 [Alphaproteobacteria bacterium]|nr:hypothetical protein [Alphaproteobacteria bacterium]
MIAAGAEIVAAMAGVIRLWGGNASAFLAFDRSLPGFWRSYTAAVIGAPIHALLLIVSREEAAGPLASVHDAAIEAITYMTTWVAYPLLVTQIVKRLDREDRFFDYMVPYNWAALAQLVLFTTAAAVRLALPGFLGSVLMLVAIAAVLHLQWFIAREGLAVTGRVAFLVVLSDISLSLMIGGLADYLKA